MTVLAGRDARGKYELGVVLEAMPVAARREEAEAWRWTVVVKVRRGRARRSEDGRRSEEVVWVMGRRRR